MQKDTKTIKARTKELLLTDKTGTIIIIIGVVALGLIFISSISPLDNKQAEKSFDTATYQQVLTEEIHSMVTSIKGAGESKILLTLDNSYEYIYLDDGKTLQKIIEPKIRGVVVVCEGADSASVKLEISELLTTALDIPSTRVYISKLK